MDELTTGQIMFIVDLFDERMKEVIDEVLKSSLDKTNTEKKKLMDAYFEVNKDFPFFLIRKFREQDGKI